MDLGLQWPHLKATAPFGTIFYDSIRSGTPFALIVDMRDFETAFNLICNWLCYFVYKLVRVSHFLAVVVAVIFLFAHSAFAARNIVLRIMVVDHWAVNQKAIAVAKKKIQKLIPNSTIIDVHSNALFNGFSKERIRGELLSQIQDLNLNSDDRITHLVLYTHGATQKGYTFLKYFGAYNDMGPDENFMPILDPIRRYTTSDLVVVQNACSVFCGGREQAVQRGRALLNYLNAPNGQIYGAVMSEVHVGFPTIGISLSVLTSLITYIVQDSTSAVIAGGAMGLIAFAPQLITFISKLTYSINIGRLLRFKNGEVQSAHIVARGNNFDSIHQRNTCEKALRWQPEIFEEH